MRIHIKIQKKYGIIKINQEDSEELKKYDKDTE